MIECIHEGKKKFLRINYTGKKQELKACDECENIIKSSSLCEVLS